jgi:hypothetical protein
MGSNQAKYVLLINCKEAGKPVKGPRGCPSLFVRILNILRKGPTGALPEGDLAGSEIR